MSHILDPSYPFGQSLLDLLVESAQRNDLGILSTLACTLDIIIVDKDGFFMYLDGNRIVLVTRGHRQQQSPWHHL